MQIVEFTHNVRIPSKTMPDVEYWTDIAGQRFREGTRLRFSEEHAAKLAARFPNSLRVVAEEFNEQREDEGEGAVMVSVTREITGIATAYATIACPSCKATTAADSRFCSRCGSRVVPEGSEARMASAAASVPAPTGPTERPARRVRATAVAS